MPNKIPYNYEFALDDDYASDDLAEIVTQRIEDRLNADLEETYPLADITLVREGYPYTGWQWQGKEERELVYTLPESYLDLDSDINESINRIVGDPGPLFDGLT